MEEEMSESEEYLNIVAPNCNWQLAVVVNVHFIGGTLRMTKISCVSFMATGSKVNGDDFKKLQLMSGRQKVFHLNY